MKKKIAIVDGYNAIYRSAELRKRLDVSLASAREGLVEHCGRWLATRGDILEFCIVFDGDSSVMPWPEACSRGVRVVFTRSKEDADDRILDLVRDGIGPDYGYLVISSDKYVSGNAKSHGAEVMSISDFFKMTTPGKKKVSGRDRMDHSDGLSPAAERAITESLKKEWGIE